MERLAVMEKRIRSVETSDADAVRDIYAPFVSDSATSFEAAPPDAAEMKKRIQDLRDQYPWLVFEEDGRVQAYAYASPHRARHAYQWSVEVSVYVHSVAHRRGIGRALYTTLFEVLRRQGYVNAYAGITLPNPASVQLHESMGFTTVGVFDRIGFKFGKWHDTAWLQLRLIQASASVPDPIPVNRFLDKESILSMFEGCARTVRLD